MQDLIKRYFWVLGGIAVMVCAVLAAKATNHVVEAKYLRDADHAPKLTPVVASATATPAKQARSKDGAAFASRNIFCSECTPPVVTATSADPSSVQDTTLPLSLLATNVGLSDDDSYATVVNTSNQHQGSYSIGDPIPGATGKVTEIHYKYIEFENSGHIERLSIAGATPPPVVAQATPTGAGSGDEMQAMIDSGIKKIDDHHFEISKELVDKVLLNPMGFTKGARVVAAMDHNKPSGFKLYSIRDGSVYGRLGFENGDTLSAINSMELTSAEKALEVYTKLRDANQLQVSITRHGKPDTLTYSIR